MATNTGKVIQCFSCPLMNSSKGKKVQIEHIYTLLKPLKEETEITTQIDAPEKKIHFKNRQIVQTPISQSTLKVF